MTYDIHQSAELLVYYKDSRLPTSDVDPEMIQEYEAKLIGRRSHCIFCGIKVVPGDGHNATHANIHTCADVLLLYSQEVREEWTSDHVMVRWVISEFRRLMIVSFRHRAIDSLESNFHIKAPLCLLTHIFLRPDDNLAIITADSHSG